MNHEVPAEMASDLALTLPLDGRHLIEASAGTGKTFTLAGLFARLVVERKLAVRDILVVTFTRAATHELRQRLRQRLVLCAELAATGTGSSDPAAESDFARRWARELLDRAIRDGDESADELAARLADAVQCMDEARIFSINGFCQRVLSEHPGCLDGALQDAELIANDRDLLLEFATDWFLRMAGDGGARLPALQAWAADPEQLAKSLAGLVDFNGRLEPAAPDPARLADIEADWQILFEAWKQHGEADCQAFRGFLEQRQFTVKYFPDDSAEKLLALDRAIRDGRRPGYHELARFGLDRIRLGCKKAAPEFPDAPAFAAIDDCLARLTAQRLGLQQQAITECRAFLKRRKATLGRCSYNDQIRLLAEAVAEPDTGEALLTTLRRQYPVALIDEFQDTNAEQFAIFDAIYRGHGSMVMVGDPKQAIYGFRGGDVHAYLAAKGSAAKHALERNFRSSPLMLEAVNAVFGQVEQPFKVEGIDFVPAQWGGKVDNEQFAIEGDPVARLTLWPVHNGGGKKSLVDAQREQLATACAATVARLCRSATIKTKPVKSREIAVLVRSNKEALLVADALRAVGLGAAVLRRESIYATAEAAAVLALFDAMLAPGSARLARGALATPLLGRSLADFHAMQEQPELWLAALDELDSLRRRWQEAGPQAMLESVMERHAARLLTGSGGERSLANLVQLGEALQRVSRSVGSMAPLREELAQRIVGADKDNEEEQLLLESDRDNVRVMTVHNSKGLEFDLVLMPFAGLCKVKAPEKGKTARYHDGHQPVRRLILQKADQRDAEEQAAVEAASEENLAEEIRLFYTGITRARHACWMSCGGDVLQHLLNKDKNKDKQKNKDMLAETVTHLASKHREAIACEDPATIQIAGTVLPTPATPAGAARDFHGRIERDWWRHSFSRLVRGGTTAATVAQPGAADETAAPQPASGEPVTATASSKIPAWPRGAGYGNAVHAILEQTDFAAWPGEPGLPPGQRDLLLQELAAAGYDGEAEATALDNSARLVRAALCAPFDCDGSRLAEIEPAERRAELEFHFGIAGADSAELLALLHRHGYQRNRQSFAGLPRRLRGLMHGIVDLVFRHQGKWWIVDYKTNYLGPEPADYSGEHLAAAIAAHDYDLQYLLYTVALHRWLRSHAGIDWDYRRDMGGVRYLFLRGMAAGAESGCGVFADLPPVELIEQLDGLLQAPGERAA